MRQFSRLTAVGIDLSLDSTGIATLLETRTIKTEPLRDGSLSEWADRIDFVAETVIELVELANPGLVVIEKPNHFGNFKLGGRQSGNWHERAGLHWRVICELKRLGYTVCQVENSKIRSVLCAHKGAKKPEILSLARRVFSWKSLVNDDEADAYTLCAIGHEWIGNPMPLLPDENRAKIGRPPWEQEKNFLESATPKKKRVKTGKSVRRKGIVGG